MTDTNYTKMWIDRESDCYAVLALFGWDRLELLLMGFFILYALFNSLDYSNRTIEQ